MKAASHNLVEISGISSNWDDDQPYSWSEAPWHPPTEKYKEASVCPQPDGKFKRAIVCPVEVQFQPGQSLPDIQSMEEATSFLEKRSNVPTEPFFLAVGFHKPHVPLKYPSKYLDLHPLESITLPSAPVRPSGMPLVSWNPWTDLRERDDIAALNISFPFGAMPDDYSKLIIQSYYAAVSYIDDLVGQLLSKIKTSGLYENTIILLIGDHGWSMADHGEWSKFSNFEISVRIPFILHVPKMTDSWDEFRPEYMSTDALVELVDIFPTLVDLTGLDLPSLCPVNSKEVLLCREGVSLLPLVKYIKKFQANDTEIESLKHKWKSGVFTQYPRPGVFPTMRPNSDKPRLKQIKVMGYSLRTQVFRYTEWIVFDRSTLKPNWNHVIARELYNHEVDPTENMNLADRSQMSDILKTLSAQLRAGWRHSLPSSYNS